MTASFLYRRSLRALCVAMIATAAFVQPKPAEAAIYRSFEALNQADEFALDVTFSSVGLFLGTDANGDEFIAGSGVLIDPWWVLTAGHVPFDEPNLYWESMKFNASADVGANLDKFVGAAAWYTFPGYTAAEQGGTGDDIGLVRLAEPIFDVQPATRFYGEDQVGTEMAMAGYGNPGVWPNAGAFDGIRRAGRNVGDSFGRLFGVTTVEEQYWVTDLDSISSGLALEWQGSKNDSGGGWFADFGGETYLVGITSGGLLTNTATFGTRVSLYNPWIDETMAAHAVPEPASALLFSFGILGLGARELKKRKA